MSIFNHKKRISRTELKASIRTQRKLYANSWADHAAHHQRGNHYQWMASFVEGRRRILEIGTGSGVSTVTLCNQGSSIIGIEHNLDCLRATQTALTTAGIPVRAIERGTIEIDPPDSYRISYPAISAVEFDRGALLVQGDIDPNVDQPLTQWLRSIEPFDAIVCWLIGTHSGRTLANQGNPQDYRLIIQNRIYEIADHILRPGGILNIIDRGVNYTNDQQSLNDRIDRHIDQASVTSLIVDRASLTSRQYTPVPEGTGIAIGMATEDGHFTTDLDPVFSSIIARKP